MSEEEIVQAQGVFDIFSLLDKQTVDKLKKIISAVDEKKIKQILDAVTVDQDGWIRFKLDLGVKAK